MADYISQLRPASFRGIDFLLPTDDVSFSRRIVVHEYPGRDDPLHEDLGQSVREFSLEAIIAGDSFLADAAAFEEALEEKGHGTLIHPHYGTINVIVMNARRLHSADAVGEIRFSLTFQRYGAAVYPQALSSTVSGLASASDGLFASVASDFNERFNVDGLQDFLVNDAASRVSSLSSTVSGLLSKSGLIATARQFIPPSWNVASGLADQVLGMFKNIAAATKPLSKAVVGSSSSSGSVVAARSVLDVMSEATQITGGSASGRAVRMTNAAALDYLFRAGALASAASAARYATYESRDDALAVRNSLAGNIEQLRDDLGESGYDNSWRDSGTVLAALTRDINQRLGRLPRTVTIQPASPRSSLALANRLYGDDLAGLFDKAGDVAIRNKIRHPGIIPVQKLEVLINA